MNNKVKQCLVLLFVVSTLLIMVGSVSANTDNLNENLEASNTLNDDLSVVEELDSAADKDVSNQLTISNIDEKTNGSSQLVGESNSENVVSNYEDTTIDAKDSDNNIIKASNDGEDVLSGSNVVITNTALNPVVNVGDEVNFEIFVRNIGDASSYGINPVGDGDFIGVSLIFNSNQLRYDHFTPGINPDTMQTHADTYRSAIVNNPNQYGQQEIWFGYNCNGGFQPGWCFNFTATFKVLSYGTLETAASIMWGGNQKTASATSKKPEFIINNTALNPVVNKGDDVSFEIVVKNNGGTYNGMYVDGVHFVGVELNYNQDQLTYTGFTPVVNPGDSNHFLEPRNWGNVLFAYECEDGFEYGDNFKFIAHFKVNDNYHGISTVKTSVMDVQDVSDEARITSRNSDLVITNTALYPNVNVGDEASFEIVVKNNGGTYKDSFISSQLNYDTNVLEFINYVPADNPEKYFDPIFHSDCVQFAYNTDGAFKYGDSFKFTVNFKVKSTGSFAIKAFLHSNNANSIANINLVDAPNFVITNTVSLPISAINDIVSFEIVVKNNGGTYYPKYIMGERFVGVNLLYDTNGLIYQGVTTDEPNKYLEPRVHPENLNNFLQFAYKVGDEGFANGDSFKFNVLFKVKDKGTFATNAQLTQFNSVQSGTSTTSMDPSLSITNTALNPFANIGDVVSFEVIGKNVGGTFTDDVGRLTLAMVTYYNLDELEYVGFAPNADNQLFYLRAVEDGKVVVFYYPDNNNFENGDIFNYTVSFKVLKHGTFETTVSSVQAFGPSSTAKIVSSDPNFTMTETPSSKTMRVGDEVAFSYVIKNEGSKYNDNYFGLDVYFDADKLEFLGLNNQNPNLSLESIDYSSTHGSSNHLLGAASGSLLGADSSVGHLKLGYASEDGFDAGSSLNFDVLFKALDDGKLQSESILEWDQSKYSTVTKGVAFAGDPSFKLTKTADNEFVNIGDYVSYEIFLENNGTLQFIDKDVIMINDWYPEGLVYVGHDVNPDKNGVMPIVDVDYSQNGHVGIKYDLVKNGFTEGWTPGSTLNITLHFQIAKKGILCNFVFSEWNSSDVSSVAVEEPELNLTKKCLNSTVDLNDLVYYEIYLENTGNFSYFDHANAYGEQFLIIEDLYPEGLEYVRYIVNPDKNGNMWESNYASVEDNSTNHIVTIKYKTWERWEPGSSLNITLVFRAVEIGKLTNVAHVFWNWKDWGPKESQKDIELNEEADVVVGPPTFSIEKISNFKEAKVGDTVSFSIIYSNTGNRTITGAYIKDNSYSSGLQYLNFSDADSWTFDGKDTWYYNGKLEAGQSATLKLFFKALTAGKHSNTALAGHNMNNDTLNDTDTVLVKEEVNGTAGTEGSDEEPDEPDEEPDEEPSEEKESSTDEVKDSVAAKSTIHPTGNPLVVLLISLLTLCFVQRKGKK